MSNNNSDRSSVDFVGAGIYGQYLTYGISVGYDENKDALAVSLFDQVSAGAAVAAGVTFNITYTLGSGFSIDSDPLASSGFATPTGLPGLAAGALKSQI